MGKVENMEDIVIIGAGGFGREVQWLIERINESEKEKTGRKRCGLQSAGCSLLLNRFFGYKGF